MSVAVFTYGSLMFDEVWSRIVSGRYTSVPATLAGYSRFAVTGEQYPGVIPGADPSADPGTVSDTAIDASTVPPMVEGVLYYGVNEADVERLDIFEGEFYNRCTEQVTVAGGMISAQVYVIKPAYQYLLAPEAWDVERFKQQGLVEFIERYKGFAQLL